MKDQAGKVMGRLFWKFFFFFWLAQLVTALGVGVTIWSLRPAHPEFGPPPPHEHSFVPGERPPPRSALPPLMPLIAGSLVSLLFAALLAWYFARPIRSLRSAFEAVAAGRMNTRVGDTMRARRDELADLGTDFDRMAERLQTVIDGQKRLLHDVSHELRSPLARLQAAVDLMRQQPERRDEFIARIERDTERMDRLVGELLTLARLDTGISSGVSMSIDLVELLDELVEANRIEAETGACTLRLETFPHALVQGNPDLLWRAVENVLRNAVRHTPPGGEVALSAAIERDQCCIRIADQGTGVDAGELTAIFEPFHRGSNTDSFSGYGLGLAITKRVMEHHGGTVCAENRAGGGLLVTLCLPVVGS